MLDIVIGAVLAWLAFMVVVVVLGAVGNGISQSDRRVASAGRPRPRPKLAIDKPDPVLQSRFEANRRAGKEA